MTATDYGTPVPSADPIPLPPEREPVHSGSNFEDLQAAGLCGNMTGSGSRCMNAAVDHFLVDEDNPAKGQIGCCGVHFQSVKDDIAQVFQNSWHRDLERYRNEQNQKQVALLKRAGLLCQSDRYTKGVTILQPGQLIELLVRAGILKEEEPVPEVIPASDPEVKSPQTGTSETGLVQG